MGNQTIEIPEFPEGDLDLDIHIKIPDGIKAEEARLCCQIYLQIRVSSGIAHTSEVVNLVGIANQLNRNRCSATISIDNQGAIVELIAIRIARDSKHIDVKAHFIKDLVGEGVLFNVEYVPTDENTAEILTEALPIQKFEYFREKLNVSRSF
ncbi:hypothetical protein JTB14_020807 [Gonioctena quinquepunctata]|nr:hypothetical protein JTB14_020807 [Gonioctena quinquepunctata]